MPDACNPSPPWSIEKTPAGPPNISNAARRNAAHVAAKTAAAKLTGNTVRGAKVRSRHARLGNNLALPWPRTVPQTPTSSGANHAPWQLSHSTLWASLHVK